MGTELAGLCGITAATSWLEKKAFAWIAGEASAVVALRHYVRVERELERKQVDAVPYWKASEAEESYHDERHHVMDEDEMRRKFSLATETRAYWSDPTCHCFWAGILGSRNANECVQTYSFFCRALSQLSMQGFR